MLNNKWLPRVSNRWELKMCVFERRLRWRGCWHRHAVRGWRVVRGSTCSSVFSLTFHLNTPYDQQNSGVFGVGHVTIKGRLHFKRLNFAFFFWTKQTKQTAFKGGGLGNTCYSFALTTAEFCCYYIQSATLREPSLYELSNLFNKIFFFFGSPNLSQSLIYIIKLTGPHQGKCSSSETCEFSACNTSVKTWNNTC